MKTWILSSILVFCLAVGFMAGCNENSSRAEQKENPNQVGTKENRSDTAITAELKGKITDDDLLNHTDISVDTKNGVVALTGTIATDAQKARAEELAKNTTGVVSVNNQLGINPDQSKGMVENAEEKAKEGYSESKDALSNARITSEVKLKFAADDTVKALNIDVDTNEGVVTLNGTVNSKKELNQAVRLAKSVDGVKHVKSNLTVSQQ
ncbi:BON domain-containing protein [bacterium]|nr:BON domain-containing protein [bacterium]